MVNRLSVREELLRFLRREFFEKRYRLPKIGVYHPSILCRSCLKDQWNYYKITTALGQVNDDDVLRISEGLVWHSLIEKMECWTKTEVGVRRIISLNKYETIEIHGRADAVNGDAVYEFKKTAYIPAKPRFQHILQLNFYMECLGKPQGVLVYLGPAKYGNFDVVEYYWSLSDWHTQHLIDRAVMLHRFLKSKDIPGCSCRSKWHDVEWERFLAMKGEK